jgi:O-antigen/teichoic acid export membrane protein
MGPVSVSRGRRITMVHPSSTVPRNAFYNALASGLQVAVAFALVPFVIAHAGESGYGLWVLLSTLSITGLFAFLDFGLIGSVVKWVADYAARGERETAGRVVDVSLLIFVPVGGALAALLLLGRPWLVEAAFDIPAADRPLASWMVAGFAIQVVADFVAMPLAGVAQAFLCFGWLRALQSIKLVAFALGSVALLTAGHGVQAMPWLAAALAWLYLPAIAWLAHRQLPEWRPRIGVQRALWERVLQFSAKVFALRGAGAVSGNMDKLIIGAWLGTVAVKDYDIVFKLHALALMPVLFVTPLVVPLASALSARADRAGLRALVLRGSKLLGAICLPVVVAIFALAEPLLAHWLGPGEAGRADLVRLYVAYLFFWPFVQIGWNALIGHDRVGPLAVVAGLAIGANLALSLALVVRYGLAGVIAATVVTNAAAFVVYLRMQLRAFGATFGQFARIVLWPNAISLLSAAAVIFGLLELGEPGSLLATGAVGAIGVATSLVLFWLFGLDPAERRLLAGSLLRGRAVAGASWVDDPESAAESR